MKFNSPVFKICDVDEWVGEWRTWANIWAFNFENFHDFFYHLSEIFAMVRSATLAITIQLNNLIWFWLNKLFSRFALDRGWTDEMNTYSIIYIFLFAWLNIRILKDDTVYINSSPSQFKVSTLKFKKPKGSEFPLVTGNTFFASFKFKNLLHKHCDFTLNWV